MPARPRPRIETPRLVVLTYTGALSIPDTKRLIWDPRGKNSPLDESWLVIPKPEAPAPTVKSNDPLLADALSIAGSNKVQPPIALRPGVRRYGRRFPPGTNDLTIELHCFLHGVTQEDGGLGKFGHFKNVVDMIWNRPDSPKKFVWTDWAEEMFRAACENKYLAVAGCASSGKSHNFAVWGIVNYMAAPQQTLVLATSTTLREARGRIWKSISSYWAAVPGLPGKMVDSVGRIRGIHESDPNEYWDGTGVLLVPSEKKSEREAVGKLVGIKAPRVILIADELPELPESLLHAAYSNLSANAGFQLIALGNPASHFDAFGIFCEPKEGWGTVSEADYEWETRKGKCIRFNAELGKNYQLGRQVYPFLQSKETIDDIREMYGERSLPYYRMVRAFWAPVGTTNGIYVEADIIRGPASQRAIFTGPTTRVAGLDPSFTAGGDRTIAYFGTIGPCDGRTVLQLDEWVAIKEDAFSKEIPRSQQIARSFIAECRKRGILPHCAGLDATGGGGPFADMLAVEWGTSSFFRVNFGGAATMRRMSAIDEGPAKDRYTNRMSEIWHVGKELIRSGQLRNIGPDLAREMVGRTYETTKSGGVKIKVESKTDYRSRTGHSPDIADAAFVLIDLCRERFGLSGNERFEVNKTRHKAFKEQMMQWDSVYWTERDLIA
jgi:hypothetical protein